MSVAWHYRGRSITSEEMDFLRRLLRDHPELSRWKLSRQVCEAWPWKQANGELRDMVCRGLLLALDRAGEIQLPPRAPQSAESFGGAPAARTSDPRQPAGARAPPQHHSP